MREEAKYWIDRLGLVRHPEGVFYRETYRSEEMITAAALAARYGEGERAFSTAICFLLEGDDFSALHRLRSDELWHFYTGEPLYVHELDENGGYVRHQLGGAGEEGGMFQLVIKAGRWFGASLRNCGSFALVGCTVAPGFDFRDFEMGDRSKLLKRFPERETLIRQLTRGSG
ncbi:MAG: cupin domain-containing protein [Geobacteraceae bacterium]|nr:cupin domain-containing protein [Geobacteraceae bacterium]